MIDNYRASRRLSTCTRICLGAVVALASSVSIAQSQQLVSSLDSQRQQFTLARAQLAAGDDAGFERTLESLQGYPLRDYLVFEQLQRRFDSVTPSGEDIDALNDFEMYSGHESLSRRLTRKLQSRFADTGQWQFFLSLGQSRLAAGMPCTTLRAKHETGQIDGFDDAVIEQWVKPQEHAKVCADVIAQIEQAHTPPLAAIWERVYQAMEANKPEYAKAMLGYLSTPDRRRVQAWIDGEKNPQEILRSDALDENTVFNRRMVADLVIDWSREDTVAAVEHWMSISSNYTFFGDRYYDTQRALVMRAAYRRMPEAQGWLANTDGRSDDLELAEWRVRTALLAENWSAVLETIERLPAVEQTEDHWAYWVARAYEQLDRADEAKPIYTRLSKLQSYHGFLAADRIGVDYAIYDEPIKPSAELLATLRADPALVRAREFNMVDLEHESRREWNNWLQGREPEEAAASAVLASEWGMHDRAIYSAGRSGEEWRRAISLRFPLLYRAEVAEASTTHSIEPAWIYGVMRRESAYIRDVRSGAGAIGLMQLMPRTAQYVANLQGQKNWQGDLTDATTNIGMGTHYLRYVMNKFDDHQVLATASYNAGPHRVDQWLRENEIAADIWIDTIPFTETRRYVRAVMAYAAIYEFHLTGEPQRLSLKLRTVPAAPSA